MRSISPISLVICFYVFKVKVIMKLEGHHSSFAVV
jgi:hypothetical protein